MFIPNIYDYAPVERIIAIGDVHGDIRRFKNILKDASIINDELEWIAEPPNTIIVQVGDQVDSMNRTPDIPEWEVLEDINIIYFTESLDHIARAKGGRVISLIGNHELMNVIGNFSYVSAKSNVQQRLKMFQPCGTLSSILSNRPLVLKIGPHFFCHAGIKKAHLDLLDKFNKGISYVNEIWKKYLLENKVNIEDKVLFDELILQPDGILWTRDLDNVDDIEDVLKRLNCRYIYTGHNLMNDGIKIYENKLWFLDNGISRAFGKNSYQYIEIKSDAFHIKEISE